MSLKIHNLKVERTDERTDGRTEGREGLVDRSINQRIKLGSIDGLSISVLVLLYEKDMKLDTQLTENEDKLVIISQPMTTLFTETK